MAKTTSMAMGAGNSGRNLSTVASMTNHSWLATDSKARPRSHATLLAAARESRVTASTAPVMAVVSGSEGVNFSSAPSTTNRPLLATDVKARSSIYAQLLQAAREGKARAGKAARIAMTPRSEGRNVTTSTNMTNSSLLATHVNARARTVVGGGRGLRAWHMVTHHPSAEMELGTVSAPLPWGRPLILALFGIFVICFCT